ncbi:MAG: HAMP domain-containing histidine kinase, partial [Ruminococcaceae bacterium]|nr:HAMP domain-containing histidine kinase [Oscillospiraceae bacterium]
MKKKDQSAVSIKLRMLAYIAAFTLFMLLLVWVFQVLLLGRFYESTKLSELNSAADEISANIENEEKLNELSVKYATEYQMYVRVFKIESGISEQIVSSQIFGSFYIRAANNTELSRLYEKALGTGTYYEPRIIRENYTQSSESQTDDEARKEMICVRIIENEEYDYVLMLDIIYTPLGATVTTLMKQFSWICLVLLGGAVILAAAMSKWVSQPIVKMNEEAKKLGRGDFDVSFPRDGYLETRELADTLNFAAGELAKTENLRRELISNLSHDLRTPLTMITGYSEVMRDIPGENTPENVQV